MKTGKGTARKRQPPYRQLSFKRKVTAWIGSRGRLLFLFILLILRAILRDAPGDLKRRKHHVDQQRQQRYDHREDICYGHPAFLPSA